MNRETKIGMLTGLAVIVLIGVLLSQYFERDNAAPRAMRPANLEKNFGESFRVVAGSPVGVAPVDSRTTGPVNGGGMPGGGAGLEFTGRDLTAFARSGPGEPSGPGLGGPVVGPMVTPMPAGSIPVSARSDQAPPLELMPSVGTGGPGQAVYVAMGPGGGPGLVPAPGVKPVGETYAIVKGDSLTTIAKKYYHSATKADIARIVLANGALLKDDKTQLVIGKKLQIPPAPKPEIAKADPLVSLPPRTETPRPDARGTEVPRPVIIPLPGVGPRVEPRTDSVVTRVEAPRVYKVQKGDTLTTIAKKFLGSGSKDAIAKIATLNKIKDSASIQEGAELKIPAKDAAAATVSVPARAHG